VTARVALITGAARGIGAEIARVLAADGFAVAAADVRDCSPVVAEIRDAGGVAGAYDCDIRSWEAVAGLVSHAERDLGPLRACVQVAGAYRVVPFLEMEPAGWRQVLDVNIDGTFHVCRLAAERIVANGGGSMVAISSTAARLAWDNTAHYCVSKAAIEALVRNMAYELGGRGVRVNAVAPGTIRTSATFDELAMPGVEASEADACPLGRIGEPMDIAQAVRFLCDDARSAWITGQSLVVDGGYSTHGQGADFGSTCDSFVEAEGGERG
jgi:NAD(P)-dependent dehydrogenase (short-subunit alcohol dehydrogenase family)